MPPVAPVRSASHGIEQMDHIRWEDVYHSPFTTVEDIPAELQVEFARATATVLNSAMTARRQGDEPNATRWLKCWRLFGQLMLRVPPRGGRRTENPRFELTCELLNGEFGRTAGSCDTTGALCCLRARRLQAPGGLVGT